jgi:hypothetical protein
LPAGARRQYEATLMIGHGSRLVLWLATSALLAVSPAAEGKEKKKKAGKPGASACGISFLPLVEGTEWTYKYFVPDGVEIPPGLHVVPPDTLTIKVDKVEQSGDSATITVTETYRKVSGTREITCSKDSLQVPIDSFFFNGEPGGGIAIKLDKMERKGDSFLTPGKGLKEDTYQEFKALATRVPTEGSGAAMAPANLEVERKMVVRGNEATESEMGDHKAIRVDIELTGRAALESQKDKPFNMPAVPSSMWFAPGVGVVRAESRMGWGWKLQSKK